MVFKDLCALVLWMKVASALEGLSPVAAVIMAVIYGPGKKVGYVGR